MINKKGFTLIELLVVISIIGILAAISLVSFSAAQRDARDTQRKSDLRQYSTSLEAFANANNGLYPSLTNTTNLSAGGNTLCTYLGLTNCPGDPNSAYVYKYISDGGNTGIIPANATKYVLWAHLESDSTKYWVVCSNGKSNTALISSWTDPTGGNCPI